MKTFHLVASILLTGASAVQPSSAIGQEWGVVRYVHQTVNIRSGRTTDASIVGQLERGQSVKADFLRDNWFAVFALKESVRSQDQALGYVYAPLLKPDAPSAADLTGALGPLPYRVAKRQDISYRGSNRMTYRVALDVQEVPSEPAMCKTAKAIWRNGNTRWDEFTVWLYLPGMNTGDLAYVTAEFRPSGLLEFTVQEAALYGTRWQNAKRPPSAGCGT